MSDGVMRLLTSYQLFDAGSKEEIKENRAQNGGKIVLKGLIQRADALNQNGRVYPRHILEREIRNYQKLIQENRSTGELDHPDACVPSGTEIFTISGWKTIDDISDDEIVATIDPKTENIEFQRIQRKIDQPFIGELLRFRNSRTYDMTLTPNHRVLMWNRKGDHVFMKASEVYDACLTNDSVLSHSVLRRAGNWIGEEPENVEIAGKIIDARLWAAFLGIYLAEGHSSGTYVNACRQKNAVVITQMAGETCDRIAELMQKLPWDCKVNVSKNGIRHDFIVHDEKLHEHLFKLGGSRQKYVPTYAKSWGPDLLNVLLEWMLMGDGRHRRGYMKKDLVPEYCTTSKQLANDVFDIMLKLGHGASVHTYQPGDRKAPDYDQTGRMILAENSAPMNIVYQHSSKNICLDLRFMKAEKVPYDGRVYCVVTPNQTWLMRQNGKVCWTGNSVINLQNVSHVVREARMEGDAVYGSIELLDTPAGKIAQSLVESGIKLGISSRGVGSTHKQGDLTIVDDDFVLICWDLVSDPSTIGAFVLPEGKAIHRSELMKVLSKEDRINRLVNDILYTK